jgi:uncharacterized protein (TIGR03435 family)
MKRWIAGALVTACAAVWAAAPVEFEVVSIKPAKPMTMGKMMVGMNADGAMLRYTNVSLKDCIREAYQVRDYQIQGPDWLESERFDIVAKLPAGSNKKQIPEMLQAMLAERFHLAVKQGSEEHAVYALIAGKGGPKLKKAEVETSPKPDERHVGGMGGKNAMMMRVSPEGVHLMAPSATLGGLAEMMSHFAARPVVDMTGIPGEYDFELTFAPETMRAMPFGGGPGGGPGGGAKMGPPPGAGERDAAEAPAEPAPSIYDAVKAYGLKLEPRKAPMETVVVEHVDRMPTEN